MSSYRLNTPMLAVIIVVTALVAGTITYLLTPVSKTASPPGTPASVGTGDGAEAAAAAGKAEREIVYWRAPMDPMEIYDAPGKSKMGMDLVPVYKDEVDGGGSSGDGDRKIVYWRAPMDPTEIYDAPGKSKMGMDLVPVYEDELVGGVDIKIDPVVRQNMGLKTAAVKEGELTATIRTYGHVTYDDTRTFVISSKAGGWIERLYADYTGYFVEKGQPLYEIYSPALVAAQEEYLSAFKNYARSRSPLNRELLASAGKRLGYFDIGPEEITALEASGQIAKRLVIRSAYDGVVIRKNIQEGAYVKPGSELFTVSDLSRVWVEAHIFEYEQHRVRPGQTAQMTLEYQPGKVFTGKIAYVFPFLQPKTRDVVIRLEFDNPDLALKPDMFVKISIETGQGIRGLSIPAEAVIHAGDEKIVFLQKSGGKFSPRTVTTGQVLDNGDLEVITGLTRDDTVVVSGQFLLDSESKLKEAIQKMMEAQKAPDSDEDDFFEDMEGDKDAGGDFFEDMDGGEKEEDFFKDMEQGEAS